jgi:hypothetical protein
MAKKLTLEAAEEALMAEADRVIDLVNRRNSGIGRIDDADLYRVSKVMADYARLNGDKKEYRRHMADAREYKPKPKEYALTILSQQVGTAPKSLSFTFSWQTIKGEPLDLPDGKVYLIKVKHLNGRLVNKASELPVMFKVYPDKEAVDGLYKVSLRGRDFPKEKGIYSICIDGYNERIIEFTGEIVIQGKKKG